MAELKITSEKVLEAASKYSAAKEMLKTLFPEVFNTTIDQIKSFEVSNNTSNLIAIAKGVVYDCPDLIDRSFILSGKYKWEIKQIRDHNILIPTKK